MSNLESILREMDLGVAYQYLTEREKKVINLYYLEGYKDEEIADLYKVSRQTINESRQKGINKLKKF